jgi:hypothetical protein
VGHICAPPWRSSAPLLVAPTLLSVYFLQLNSSPNDFALPLLSLRRHSACPACPMRNRRERSRRESDSPAFGESCEGSAFGFVFEWVPHPLVFNGMGFVFFLLPPSEISHFKSAIASFSVYLVPRTCVAVALAHSGRTWATHSQNLIRKRNQTAATQRIQQRARVSADY